ncbi:lipase family protein [Rhodococcus sp. NPDC003348]
MNGNRRIAATAAALAALWATGCSAEGESPQGALPPKVEASTASAPAPQGAERGEPVGDQQLIDTTVTTEGVTARRITYRSTSGLDGGGTEVTGVVFIPPGAPPEGGWPIVSVGHPTTGVDDACAPSGHPDLLGGVAIVDALLARGFVVVASDYQGLGTDGPHPYLEPKSAAYNLIDAVRAARAIVSGASNRWAAFGISQGGQASWSAAEHAADYGDGLEFVGAASLSPAADLSYIADDLSGIELTLSQQIFLPLLLAGIEVQHPDLDPGRYVHGTLAENEDIFTACAGTRTGEKWDAALRITRADSMPSTAADTDRMREWLRQIALPQRPTAAPLLVVVGDTDDLIPADWTRAAVAKACGMGDLIELQDRPGEGHADARANPGAVAWIADRFAGVPAPNTCAADVPPLPALIGFSAASRW